ncbi:hypothetical protein C8N32_1366 [Rhodovulum imhoffii]|uniref:DUF6314 domain-containing protein n=1 Tax=Rhodovulum imhoffii TaxID=365340 RepID=A0A2T5BL25_9RHOB|nr:DUF6314 family protein [Rhodovulum imhoffii]MBK5932503.1 hypothetical protein [Rhodovulum imhoffii]PTM99703.1 hypothetical protein C8N32_1366 [Rhodovulum imhoffii]
MLENFEGLWRLTRKIDDTLTGQCAVLEGQASFTVVPGGLRYEEEGTLRWPGQPPMMARRVYLWHAVPGRIDVCFADGRFFHSIAPGATPEASHDCPPDFYHVRYDFSRWPDWSAVWDVHGPRKTYAMRSLYSR